MRARKQTHGTHAYACPVCMAPAEIGLGLTAFGALFGFVGVIFFFDRGLIAMGNVGGMGTREQPRDGVGRCTYCP